MELDNIFDKYTLKETTLLEFGFIKKNDAYILKQDLKSKEFYVIFEINTTQFNVKVFEAGGEEFLPFYIKKTSGSYVTIIKQEVAELIDNILIKCFESNNIREKIITYVENEYQTIVEYPWQSDAMSGTFKTPSKKWYGLIMNIPYKYLKIDKEGTIDILNLKNKPEKIEELIDHLHYFPAYHMNKKYWISILLDSTSDLEQIKKLLDESYQLVYKKH